MPRAARVDDRRNARADAEDIRVGAEGAETVHQMQVDVDQTGTNENIVRVDYLRLGGSQIRPDRRDDAVADQDVQSAVALRARIEHAAVFDEQVGHSNHLRHSITSSLTPSGPSKKHTWRPSASCRSSRIRAPAARSFSTCPWTSSVSSARCSMP